MPFVYIEYDGPDLGYLSVTIDCLWDAYDATGDDIFKLSAARALGFIEPFISMPQCGAGMHNSRNTDYILPYGIARFLDDEIFAESAAVILSRVYDRIDQGSHFLYSIDDRYYCHYVGHSLFRSADLIGDLEHKLPSKVECYFDGTGHWLRSETCSGCAAVVSAKKGGILSLFFDGDKCMDFGWVFNLDGQEWVSH